MANASLDKETFFRRMKRIYAAWKVRPALCKTIPNIPYNFLRYSNFHREILLLLHCTVIPDIKVSVFVLIPIFLHTKNSVFLHSYLRRGFLVFSFRMAKLAQTIVSAKWIVSSRLLVPTTKSFTANPLPSRYFFILFSFISKADAARKKYINVPIWLCGKNISSKQKLCLI